MYTARQLLDILAMASQDQWKETVPLLAAILPKFFQTDKDYTNVAIPQSKINALQTALKGAIMATTGESFQVCNVSP